MNWDAVLEFAPVVTPDGQKLVTLSDARAYLLEHPDEIAAGEVLKAAQDPNQFTLHCARQALSRAVHGTGFRPTPRKETLREKRARRR
jgi:hypothetical protein